MVLKSTLSHEPPAKRPKVDKSDTEKESLNDIIIMKKNIIYIEY